MPVAITLRQTKGSPLTVPELDTNFSNLKAFVEGFETQINARLNPDGTLKNGAVASTAALGDGIVTRAKMAADSASALKVLRYDASGNVIAGDFLQTQNLTDSDGIGSTGVQTAKLISTIVFANVPAGNIMVVATAWANRNNGSNGGTLSLKNGDAIVCSAPTHSVDLGTSGNWVPLPMHGIISAFAGGTLTLTFEYETSENTSDITFGVTGDGRFGRSVTLLAGA